VTRPRQRLLEGEAGEETEKGQPRRREGREYRKETFLGSEPKKTLLLISSSFAPWRFNFLSVLNPKKFFF